MNNIKPTESMINSSFANNNKNNNNISSNNNNNNSNLKLRTGYSEVFSNNNSNVNNNVNNLNNLVYTSNNNLSEVSSHINNSNHYINFKAEIGKQISNNKSQFINIGKNNSEKKEIKNINNILNNNSNHSDDLKLKKSNLTDPNTTEIKQNINKDNVDQDISVRKKKKLKFINNVSKENIQEIKQNSLSIFDKPEVKSTKNLSLNPTFSFGQIQKSDNVNEEINKTSEKNEKKEINNTNNVNNNNINNQSINWNYNMGNGFTRILGNNSNILGYGLNDTNLFIANNTLNYNSFYDNTNFFKNNMNDSNLFKIDHTRHLNDVNQLSQMSYLNQSEEKQINNSFIGNDNNIINDNNNLKNNFEEKDKELLGKKRKAEEKIQKKEKKNNNNKIVKEKKNKKNINLNSNIALKTPSFSSNNNFKDFGNNNNIYPNQNRINNFRMSYKGINNNNYGMINNINNYQNFPYNIDIPLPSKFFEESVGNYKK